MPLRTLVFYSSNVSWEVVLDEDVEAWLLALEEPLYERVATAIDMLADIGPGLGRPLVDQITSSKHPNMKELRVATARILFAFDPARRAVLLVAGDKSGRWNAWYPSAIDEADRKFDALLKEMKTDD